MCTRAPMAGLGGKHDSPITVIVIIIRAPVCDSPLHPGWLVERLSRC